MRKTLPKALLVLSIIFFASVHLVMGQTTWFISIIGDDITGDGSSGNPYATIQKAINSSTDGDIINVANGAYSLTDPINVNKSLTFNGTSNTLTIINFTGSASGKTASLFKVTASNVNINKFMMVVDLSKIHSAVITSGLVNNLSVNDNNILATRTTTGNAYGYGFRNALAFNPNITYNPTLTHINNPSNSCSNYQALNNTISGSTLAENGVGDAYFRAGIQLDRINGYLIKNNVFNASVNHDILTRFLVGLNNSTIEDNIFKGGGVEVSSTNDGLAKLDIINNTFDGTYSQNSNWAMLRLRINSNQRELNVTSNTFINQKYAISIEDYTALKLENNSFTPGVNNFKLVSINTKPIVTAFVPPLQQLSAKFYSNTFNGYSGASVGTAIFFANFQQDGNDNYLAGNIEIGGIGKQNIFGDNIPTFFTVNNSNGVLTTDAGFKASYEEYNDNLYVSTTGYWKKDIIANNNQYFIDGQLRNPFSMTVLQRTTMDTKIFDKNDDSNIGEIILFYPVNNINTGAGYATIQSAIDAASNGNTLDVSYQTYSLSDAISVNKELTIRGNNNDLLNKPIITGTGNGTNKALFEISAPNVTIQNFEIQVAQKDNAMIGIATTVDNFNNLTIADNIIKGMKTYNIGYEWNSYALKLSKNFAPLKNKITIVRNTITYNNLLAPELFGRAIYAFYCSGKIGGSNTDKNTLGGLYSLQSAVIGDGTNDFEFSYNDVILGLISIVGAEVGNHKINNNTFGNAVSSLAQANQAGRIIEIRGSRTTGANIEFANNTINKFSKIGLFIQRSNNITVKANTFTPFQDNSNTDFHSIVFSSKEGTTGSQAAATSSNLTITGNIFNPITVVGGTGITFLNHNANATVQPLTNGKIGGSGTDKNTFSSSLSNYIVMDETPSGNTKDNDIGSYYSILYDATQDNTNKTNILPFNSYVDASYNIFGSVDTETETNFANLVAVEAKIKDGIDNPATGFISIQPNKAFLNTAVEFGNALAVVPDNFTLNIKDDSGVYGSLGDKTIINAHTIAVYNNSTPTLQFNKLTSNAVTKEVKFSNPVDVASDFSLANGKITPSSTFTLNGSVAVASSPNNFINGAIILNNVSTDLTIPVGKGNRAAYIALSNTSGSSSSFNVEYFPSSYGNNAKDAGLTSVSQNEYWNINRTSGNLGAKVTLTTNDLTASGLTGGTMADTRVAYFNTLDSKWYSYGNEAYSGTLTAFVEASDQSSDFGFFTFGSNNPVLPVQLIDFSAQASTGGALLKWYVSSERSIQKYQVEKSVDGTNFKVIGEVAASGNSIYNFTDLNFNQAAYYRLVSIDINGQNNIYNKFTRFVKSIHTIDLVVYPNPTTDYIYLSTGSANSEVLTFKIFDNSGKLMKVQGGNSDKINAIDMRSLSNGVYILQVIKSSGNVTEKIIKK